MKKSLSPVRVRLTCYNLRLMVKEIETLPDCYIINISNDTLCYIEFDENQSQDVIPL